MNLFHLGLAAMMLVTGSINTLSVKWADTMKSESTDGTLRGFTHPFLQACGMFLGEMLCMVAYYVTVCYRKRKRTRQPLPEDAPPDPEGIDEDRVTSYNPFIFLPPALCDMTATSIQYIGLNLTYASSFQMLRGAVIVFTGILSTIFLRRRLQWFRWLGIFFVICGLVTVGTTDIIYTPGTNGTDTNVSKEMRNNHNSGIMLGKVEADDHSSKDILIGDILIVCAQVIVATQMVYEEKFVSKYNVPALQAVGWEGTFGFLTLSTLLVPFYFIPVGDKFGNNPRHVLEDAYDGLYQLAHNSQLAGAFTLTIFSIAFFNFAGISVTKEMSATTRMVLDSIRTLVIWSVSLAIGWQTFHLLQLLGFSILLVGMLVYNDIIIVPGIKEILYRLGIVDRPGSYYTMQNEIEAEQDDEEEDQDNGRSGAEDTNAGASSAAVNRDTSVFDPRNAEH